VVRRVGVTLGRSADGRPITATATNGIGDGQGGRSGWPRVLVIGCIHGDECAGIDAVAHSERGCPPPGDGLVTVPNLNPDGLALGTRLNARGVDLNRNFASDWRPIGVPGDPEHSGPAPFSEPETRIARRLITALRPDVTIWFHQQEEELVRAWGPSVPAARAYARLAGEPFRRMPWLDGTAPNWQNHRFPGTSSFVVELPLSGPTHPDRNGEAIFQLARELEPPGHG
jgi:protein MpaA